MTTPPRTTADLDRPFPPVTRADWRAAARRQPEAGTPEDGPAAETRDGPSIRPLYTAADVDPAEATREPRPPTRPNGWTIAQRYDHPDPAVVNRQILADLERGAGGIWLRLDRATRLGFGPRHPEYARHAGADGMIAPSGEELERALDGVHLEMVHLAFDAGEAAPSVGEWLQHVVKQRGLDPASIHAALDFDPLGALAAEGRLSLGDALAKVSRVMTDTAAHFDARWPNVHTVCVSTLPYHAAGAGAAQELAYSLATAAAYLRAFADSGWSSAWTALSHLRFVFAIDSDFWTEVAKLRAARRLWARVAASVGDADAADQPMVIHAVTSPRTLTGVDPGLNLVRATAQTIAAVVGGADSISTLPFDAARGPSDAFARRLAVNTQAILQLEAQLGRIADPAGGSWAAERLTDDLARHAWAMFQDIERAGGVAEALTSGRVQAEMAAAATARSAEIAGGDRTIIGVTRFPPPGGAELEPRESPDVVALASAAARRLEDTIARHPHRDGFSWPRLLVQSDTPVARISAPPLTPIRDAAPFEGGS